MADNFEKNLNDAIEEVVKGYKNAAKVAAKKATEKTADFIYNQALSCLEAYYQSYKPKSYERTYTLEWCFVKNRAAKIIGDNIYCRMGVTYDPSKLDGFYWKKRGPNYNSYQEPDSQWVIDNYLRGVHPSTSDGKATMQYGLNYEEKTGMFKESSPTKKMGDLLEYKAKKEFERWFWTSLLEQTLSSIK